MKLRVPVTIVLIDEDGLPVSGPIKLVVKRGDEVVYDRTINVGSSGIVSTLLTLEPGKYTFSVVYPGDDEHEQASISISKIIKPKPQIKVTIVG